MTLTLADANRMIAGAIEKANQIGAKMNIAVCDAGGRLLAFQRMDGAMWAGAFGSQGKAMASAAFGRPSGDLTPRADHPTLRGIAAAEGGHDQRGRLRRRDRNATARQNAGPREGAQRWWSRPRSTARPRPRTPRLGRGDVAYLAPTNSGRWPLSPPMSRCSWPS